MRDQIGLKDNNLNWQNNEEFMTKRDLQRTLSESFVHRSMMMRLCRERLSKLLSIIKYFKNSKPSVDTRFYVSYSSGSKKGGW